VELSNGCLCCSTGGDLSAAIHRVLRGRRPDWIVVELSGVADPYPVLRELALLSRLVAISNLIAVVDLTLEPRHAAGSPVLLRALAAANTIVLNKEDRAEAIRRIEWEKLARSANPRAHVHFAQHGRLPRNAILADHPGEVPDREDEPAPVHARFHTTTLAIPSGCERARLEALLSSLGERLDRAKGFVSLREGWFLLQLVRGQWTLVAAPDKGGADLTNRIVVISSRMTATELRDHSRPWLQPCAAWPGPLQRGERG
jgi:G3E family GTPase